MSSYTLYPKNIILFPYELDTEIFNLLGLLFSSYIRNVRSSISVPNLPENVQHFYNLHLLN